MVQRCFWQCFIMAVPGVRSSGRCFCTQGLNNLLWSHIPYTATVSDTQDIFQNESCIYLGPHINISRPGATTTLGTVTCGGTRFARRYRCSDCCLTGWRGRTQGSASRACPRAQRASSMHVWNRMPTSTQSLVLGQHVPGLTCAPTQCW